jgi:peptidoglycan/xylan/chitin deacetylase (PgdA/CDA1 family)
MTLHHLMSKARWSTISVLCRRNTILRDFGPIVSFTFDDFPRSALEVGGSVLKNHGAAGTYYAAMQLMGTVTVVGEQFRPKDLDSLQRDGHELGSHTSKHVSCRSMSISDFGAEVAKGRECIIKITGIQEPHNFAYPFGHVTVRAKATVGRIVTTCRGNRPGINENPIDLNLLKANSLYGESMKVESLQKLLDLNEERGGWLIFYTHDIADEPSKYGCKTGDFERIVKLVTKRRCKVLRVSDVVAHLDSVSAGSGR